MYKSYCMLNLTLRIFFVEYVCCGIILLPLVQIDIFYLFCSLPYTLSVIYSIAIHQNKGKCQIVPNMRWNQYYTYICTHENLICWGYLHVNLMLDLSQTLLTQGDIELCVFIMDFYYQINSCMEVSCYSIYIVYICAN